MHPRLRNIKAEMHTKGNETRSNIAVYPLQIKREDAVIKAYVSDQEFGDRFLMKLLYMRLKRCWVRIT